MSYLSMMESRLPPGFRFHPRDEELVCDYLARKLSGEFANGVFSGCPMLIDVDLNKCEPWDLPAIACVGGKEWYFFSLRDRKYATGQRTNRATMSGYWKATGKDRPVARKATIVGMRKTLVFYQGRAPKGTKTDWVMHEFRMEGQGGGGGGGGGGSDIAKLCFKEDWVLCRVFFKSRGMSTKPSMETWCDDSGSSSLPPLMDTYITFDQNQVSFEGYEQVPCFSTAPPSCSAPHILPLERSLATRVPGANFGVFHDSTPLSCDKKVIRAVLSHLTKLEGNQRREDHPNMADGGLGCYLSEAGLAPTWNPFGS